MPETVRFYRRKLPHWIVSGASYFVTIRLKNTLPKHVIEAMRLEGIQLEASGADNQQLHQLRRKHFVQIESILDAADASQRWLDNPKVAQVVMDSLGWLNSQGWMVYAAVILSTHVHLLIRNDEGRTWQLLEDLARFKNYTACMCNRVVGRKGSFWAREHFDHWIRNGEKFERVVRYIAMNPVKAGRVERWKDWPWTVVDPSVVFCLDGK